MAGNGLQIIKRADVLKCISS